MFFSAYAAWDEAIINRANVASGLLFWLVFLPKNCQLLVLIKPICRNTPVRITFDRVAEITQMDLSYDRDLGGPDCNEFINRHGTIVSIPLQPTSMTQC